MSKTCVRVSILGSCLLGLAVLTSGAQARGIGGFHHGGHGIAVGEPHPGMPHHGGGGHWHGRGWGSGFGWYGVGYPVVDDGCRLRRVVDAFGRIVVRRVCD